jgi:ribosomal protein S18 acetylase RimI-like enzyme
MQLEEHADASAFLEAAAPVLAADEARHNLIYGICSTLIDSPQAYPEAHLWTVVDGEPLAAAVLTPPFNVVVAQPRVEQALRFLGRELRGRVELPGVTGALPEVETFAESWGAPCRLRMSQGIYAARRVELPRVGGRAREAVLADRELVLGWLRAFEAEALPEDAAHLDLEASFERRVQSDAAGFALWEDDGEPVSLCGYGGRTPTGIRIGPVYTPPQLRGRGYGSAVTAQVTKEQLDSGRDYCFLYTDLSNATSNKIYVGIGYERVCDSAEYSFD